MKNQHRYKEESAFYNRCLEILKPHGFVSIYDNHQTLPERQFDFIKDGVRIQCFFTHDNDEYFKITYDIIQSKYTYTIISRYYNIKEHDMIAIHRYFVSQKNKHSKKTLAEKFVTFVKKFVTFFFCYFFVATAVSQEIPKYHDTTLNSDTSKLRWKAIYKSGALIGFYLKMDSMVTTSIEHRIDMNSSISMTLNSSNNIKITGDTIACIKSLLLYCHNESNRRDSVERSLRATIKAAVTWTNRVPVYWKHYDNNCGWPEYWALLQLQGYSLGKNPDDKNDCK